MLRSFRMLAADDRGFIISAELVLVLTIAVLGMVVGLTAVRDAVVNELNDLAHAFGAVNQSYSVTGLRKARWWNEVHAWVAGFGFKDTSDECDCEVIEYIDVSGKRDPSDGAPNEANR